MMRKSQCDRCRRDRAITLELTGEQVCNHCERHRAECEARAVLAMPSKEARRLYLRGGYCSDGTKLRGVLGARGEAACKAIEDLVLALWKKRNGKSD